MKNAPKTLQIFFHVTYWTASNRILAKTLLAVICKFDCNMIQTAQFFFNCSPP